jgi:hypothetical protein
VQHVNTPPPGCTFDANCNLVCCPTVCPCDSIRLWQTALAGTPLTCFSSATINAALWVNVQFGSIAAGTNLPNIPGNTCQVVNNVTGENDTLTGLTLPQVQACIAELQTWESNHGLVCTH